VTKSEFYKSDIDLEDLASQGSGRYHVSQLQLCSADKTNDQLQQAQLEAGMRQRLGSWQYSIQQ